jgi:hypothetical protein
MTNVMLSQHLDHDGDAHVRPTLLNVGWANCQLHTVCAVQSPNHRVSTGQRLQQSCYTTCQLAPYANSVGNVFAPCTKDIVRCTAMHRTGENTYISQPKWHQWPVLLLLPLLHHPDGRLIRSCCLLPASRRGSGPRPTPRRH